MVVPAVVPTTVPAVAVDAVALVQEDVQGRVARVARVFVQGAKAVTGNTNRW